MLFVSFFILLLISGFIPFSSFASPSLKDTLIHSNKSDPFTDLLGAYRKWDSQMGCLRFKEKHQTLGSFRNSSSSFQVSGGDEIGCDKDLKLKHVKVLVKGWTWIPDNLENLYECKCGLSCFWTKSAVLSDPPDALLFETTTPPLQVYLISYLISLIMLSKVLIYVMIVKLEIYCWQCIYDLLWIWCLIGKLFDDVL